LSLVAAVKTEPRTLSVLNLYAIPSLVNIAISEVRFYSRKTSRPPSIQTMHNAQHYYGVTSQ